VSENDLEPREEPHESHDADRAELADLLPVELFPPEFDATEPVDPIGAEPAAISTRNLTKRFDKQLALDKLDLEIPPGEIFGYIGPNGAGKTTTIRILSTLLEPTSGSASIHGVDVVEDPLEVKRLIGYMPDSFGVYDNMTLTEYLEFFLLAFKIDRARGKRVIEDVLALTDLGPHRDRLIATFSRGMLQRACLAKTLLHDPRVLILDEPASGLDPRARIEFRELLRELRAMGKTIFVSSHILTELATIATSIGILEAGKLVVAGAVEDVLRGIGTEREIIVRALDEDGAKKIARWLEPRPGVTKVSAEAREARFHLRGDDEALARIIEELVGSGYRFSGFSERSVDLEAAFLRLTRGELS